MTRIPTTTDAVTPAFLTNVLREGGVIAADCAVAEVDHVPIGEGVGIVGQLARLTLRYDGEAEGAPSSMVIKLPSQFPANRAIGDHFNFYEREGRFYQQIGEKAALRTPRCYYNHIDVDTGEFALLLEDFGNRTLISQIAGMGVERAAATLEAVALIHAEWWDSPALDALSWMPRLVDPVNLAAGQQYRESWPMFLEHMAEHLPEGGVALGEQVQAVFEQNLQAAFDRAPTTIVHGDFRVDNLMYDDHAEGRDRVGLVDWQITYRGPAMGDVAYLLTQSMKIEDRRRSERDLVERWYAALSDALGSDPAGFTVDDAWREYRATTLAATVYPVVAVGSLDPANERGRQLLLAMSERAFTAALDLEALELLVR